MKKHIITIAGSIGSGKSSTAKAVADALNYRHFSSGDLFRKIAAERNLTIESLNSALEARSEVDKGVDELLQKMGSEDDLVIDSRLAFHWIPDSFKVFLSLDPHDAAERIFKHIQREGRLSQTGSSVTEIEQNTKERADSEVRRYHALYGIDAYGPEQFDLVVDTRIADLSAVIQMVLDTYQKWLEN